MDRQDLMLDKQDDLVDKLDEAKREIVTEIKESRSDFKTKLRTDSRVSRAT